MTPAQALDQIIPGWQASLADKYSPAFIINLVSKHRASLEEMVAAVLGAEDGLALADAPEVAHQVPGAEQRQGHGRGGREQERLHRRPSSSSRATARSSNGTVRSPTCWYAS